MYSTRGLLSTGKIYIFRVPVPRINELVSLVCPTTSCSAGFSPRGTDAGRKLKLVVVVEAAIADGSLMAKRPAVISGPGGG